MSHADNTQSTDVQLPSSQPDHIATNTSPNNESDSTSLANDELEAATEFNSKPLKQRLRILFSNHHYKRVIPEMILWVIAGYVPAVFWAAWAAGQYSGCLSQDADEELINDCKINYAEYNKVASIFSSCGGLMAFIFGGLIGRISDSYGRKPIFYANIILSALQYTPLCIWPIVWINLVMRIPAGLNSSDNSFTPMMMAYMSDIMPEYQRTMAYSVAYAFCAVGLFAGVGLAITLGIFYGDEANFIAITILDIMQLVYVFFLVPESLKVQNRKSFSTKNLNPLRPLYHCCCYHPIVLWVAVVQFFISLPETGILDMSLIYILDQLDVQNETDANITNAIFMVACSVGLVCGPLFILPRLQKNNFTNIQILLVGTSLFFTAFILFSFLQWIKSIVIPIIGGVLITCGFISFPAANGIVTKHLAKSEQGIGFGVIFAVRSLTWIIAPISFAEMYSLFKQAGIASFTMFMGAILILIAVLIIWFPLRKTILDTVRTGRKYSFSTVELQMMDDNRNRNLSQNGLDPKDEKQKNKEMDTVVNQFETLDHDEESVR